MNEKQKQYFAKQNNAKKKIEKHYPEIPNTSGIYVLKREVVYNYVGQAKNLKNRLASHLLGNSSHLDLSIKKHGLYSKENPLGWKIEFKEVPIEQLDEKEKIAIDYYKNLTNSENYNITNGGQGKGKTSDNGYTPRKGYNDGKKIGADKRSQEIKYIIDKYFILEPIKDNKQTANALEKLNKLLGE